MADEFDALEPSPTHVPVGGGFDVRPITIDRLPAFARALRPILPTISELASMDEGADPLVAADELLELISEQGESLAEAVAIAVAKDKADVPAQRLRVGRLDPADFVLLALPVIRTNADFFARRLLPLLLEARQGAREILGAGPTQSAP